MTVCARCGRENPDGADFCKCGEYLRWEPTGEARAAGRERARPGDSLSSPADVDALPEEAAGASLDPDATMPPSAAEIAARPRGRGSARAAVSASPTTPGAPAPPPPGAVRLTLRVPGEDDASSGAPIINVVPGERAVLAGLIRNESGIVDGYDIAVTGLLEGFWSVTPKTVHLLPYGTSGIYEQEIQIHVHPPRTPEAQARPWSIEVVATSRAYQTTVARAPATVRIEPYREVSTELASERASGRLKGRFLLKAHNRANAPTELLLKGEDTDGECRFRFAQPSIAIEPGQGIEAPFTVFPPKQIWIGRPRDRAIKVAATPSGEEAPPPSLQATYRQRPWLPWWLAVVAPIAIALLVLLIKLQPQQATVPNLVGMTSGLQAQETIYAHGLKLQPPNPCANCGEPGKIVKQFPPPRSKVRRGTTVSVWVAVGSAATVPVPDVTHLLPGKAEKRLRAAHLVLGGIFPQPDPRKKIQNQIPQAPEMVPQGTQVNVYFQPAGSSNGGGSSAPSGKVPAVNHEQAAVAAAQLSANGFRFKQRQQLSTQAPGTVLASAPAPGSVPGPGSTVTLTVATHDQLSYDNDRLIGVVDGETGKPTPGEPQSPIASTGANQTEASWSSDGRELVYVYGNERLALWSPQSAGRLLPAIPAPHDPTFARKDNVLAFIEASNTNTPGDGQGIVDNVLCFAHVASAEATFVRSCMPPQTGWEFGRQLSWSRDGTKLLVPATATTRDRFGLFEFQSVRAFSANAADWHPLGLKTESKRATQSSQPQGVMAGAYSPDGKHLAEVSDLDGSGFYLRITAADDPEMNGSDVRALNVPACEVSWSSNSKWLAVVSGDCTQAGRPFGSLEVIDVSNPHTVRPPPLFAPIEHAASPSFSPGPTGG